MSPQEVAAWFKKDADDPEDENYDFWGNVGYPGFTERDIPGIGTIQVLEAQGGKVEPIEVMGDYTSWRTWAIILTPEGRVYKITGEEDSWDSPGWDWSSIVEVEKVEQVVTVWRAK